MDLKYSQELGIFRVPRFVQGTDPNDATFVETAASFQTMWFPAAHTCASFCLSLCCLYLWLSLLDLSSASMTYRSFITASLTPPPSMLPLKVVGFFSNFHIHALSS